MVVSAALLGLVSLAAGTHPVLDHHLDPAKAADYEARAATVMALDEAALLAIVPQQTGVLFCGCPNCNQGPAETGTAIFKWSPTAPLKLTCRYCGEVYPSARYPLDQVATGQNLLGETVTFRYYFDAERQQDYWLDACNAYFRKRWLVNQCLLLAQCYHLTGKPAHARRAALILDAFAQTYPHLAYLNQWPTRRRSIAKPEPPFPGTGGRWGRWMEDEIPYRLPEAYDLIYDSEELDTLSRERGADVRQRIEDDFFRGTFAQLQTFGEEPTGRHLHNIYYNPRELARMGWVIGDPAMVHWAYGWVENMLRTRYLFDGMWPESPAYHYQTTYGIRSVMRVMKGYSDPPGYRAPDGRRLDDVDMEAKTPFVVKALAAPELIAYPDGSVCPVHDTWAQHNRAAARTATRSTLLPGFRHAALGRGAGDLQMQAHLHFSGGWGHAHADSLQFALWAQGCELISDLGYTHTSLRPWAASTVAHNTVVVDRTQQRTANSEGDLHNFLPDAAGVAVVEAGGERSYPDRVTCYRRELLLIEVSDRDAYVVDLFRVRGGAMHDWLLHGSADADMTATCSLPLDDGPKQLLEPGEEWRPPKHQYDNEPSPYGLIRDTRRSRTDRAFNVTFEREDGAAVRTHLAGQAGTEVYLGRAPRIREADEEEPRVYDYWMPQLVARRRGTEPLTSLFAAVHEPFRDEPFIDRVETLQGEPPDPFAAALRVHHGELVDTILSASPEAADPVVRLADGTTLEGRLAILREQAGRVVAVWLLDGTAIRTSEFELTNDAAAFEGTVTGAMRIADGAETDALLTDAVSPAGDDFAGEWVVVTHGDGHTHGYEVARVERADGGSIIVLKDDHGLRIAADTTTEVYFPARTFAGPNRFRLVRWRFWSAE